MARWACVAIRSDVNRENGIITTVYDFIDEIQMKGFKKAMKSKKKHDASIPKNNRAYLALQVVEDEGRVAFMVGESYPIEDVIAWL